MSGATRPGNRSRLRIEVTGAVQGVGFRPFTFRLARELGLGGWVRNSPAGAEIEIEGPSDRLGGFLERLERELPAHAVLRTMETAARAFQGEVDFAIRASGGGGAATVEILPDIATCKDCLREVFDPADRRHRYPFTNCTACGPRYSIVQSLPYDRVHTTMRNFEMCGACREEYEDPADRRFHAQPNACPDCGPRLEFEGAHGRAAMDAAAHAIREGAIVAVKGIGGFHLLADARDERVVARLRERKRRPDKPLAVMFASLESARDACRFDGRETALVTSPAAPIVLVRRKSGCPLPAGLAPGNPRLGVFLPYSPLHHLLLRELGFPVVATSGNLSDEPIFIDNGEAVRRLGRIADAFLVHDRPIARAVDDSVTRIMAGREVILRRSRGYAPAPLPVATPGESPPVLAMGGDLKNTIALGAGGQVTLSQHHGDLASAASQDALARHIVDLPGLCGAEPVAVACDLHPGYHSTTLAGKTGLRVVPVQHHHAHIAACLAENDVDEEVLGVAWDGTGYGTDGTVWGGEFLIATRASFERFAWLRPFPLPGGAQAVREPRRAALGLLHEAGIDPGDTDLDAAFAPGERKILEGMLEKGINAPLTSSAGRLIDAMAALAGVRLRNSFEGQAAMDFENAIPEEASMHGFPVTIEKAGAIDWAPALRAFLGALRAGVPTPTMAACFHATMVDVILQVARLAGRKRVALSGGCFQNAWLTGRTVDRLREEGFEPLWHRRIPPNDGGLALGQAVVAASQLSAST